MVTTPKQLSVLGLPIHQSGDYVGWLIEQAQQGIGAHVVTLNAEMALLGEKNQPLGAVIKTADLVIPDGAGVVLALRFQGQSVQRSPGIELGESLIRAAEHIGPIFFYGGKPEVIEAAASHWQQQVPNLNLVGTQHGYLPPEDEPKLEQRLQDLKPRLILVGLGAPRQEFWIRDHRHLCPEAIWVGVGGSFDIWSGNKIRAPKWFCDNNLEWAYRLYQEPWRWKRMLALPQFVWRALTYRDKRQPTGS